MVPMEAAANLGKDVPGTSTKLSDEVEKKINVLPFRRGIMNFDDYNYRAFNNLILVKEPNEPILAIKELESRLKTNETDEKSLKESKENSRKAFGTDIAYLDNTVESFKQDVFTLPPSKAET